MKKSQRIGILIIMIVMLVGTIGGFIAMMVQPGNEAKDQAAFEAASKQYQAATAEHQTRVDAQAAELSKTHYTSLVAHRSRVGVFSADGINELQATDLVVGAGEEVKDDTSFATYYIGWKPDGTIFDQSIDNDSLKAPFPIDGPAKASVIEGWRKGLIGMKIGGIRELTIPAAQAYGEAGQGESIPPNTPLKFIIMAISAPETIPAPEMPQIMKDYYRRLYGREF